MLWSNPIFKLTLCILYVRHRLKIFYKSQEYALRLLLLRLFSYYAFYSSILLSRYIVL